MSSSDMASAGMSANKESKINLQRQEQLQHQRTEKTRDEDDKRFLTEISSKISRIIDQSEMKSKKLADKANASFNIFGFDPNANNNISGF
jgi:hypothetical protein